MLVHRKKRARFAVKTPLTSLIDIVFLLLIYFLLTTNFIAEEGIDIKLPNADAAAPQVRQDITVLVDLQGQVWLEGRQMTLKLLFERLQTMLSETDDRLVVVKADRGIMLGKAVAVMDVAKSAGASRLCLATEDEL
jgi:biopolymer transport protein ExbD